MSVIRMSGVEKSYNDRLLFSGVTFAIEEGTAVGILGENGSGKSVLLKIMTQFVRPDAGSVEIDPRFLSHDRVFPEKFGVLIDRPGYIPTQTGLSNLMSLARIRRQISEEQVRETMALVGLNPDLPQRVRHYSLGMKQRLGFAQAIMEDQQVLVLDEPFNTLDEDSVLEMRTLLRGLVDSGKTLVMTSHQRDDIAAVCDHSYRLRRERLEPVA